jgi:glycosyltransferase involved in cell wall biosynthesis
MLERCLGSFRDQTLDASRLEIIAIVNYTEEHDAKEELLTVENFRDLTDLDVKIIYKPLDKTAINWNVGVSQATGDYVAWIGQDDMFMPEALEAQADFLDANPEVGVTYGSFYQIDNNGNRFCFNGARNFSGKALWDRMYIFCSTFLIRRSVFNTIGYYRVEQEVINDYEFWVRANMRGIRFQRLHNVITGQLCNRPDSSYYKLKHLEPDELGWLRGEYREKELWRETIPCETGNFEKE